MRAIVRRVENKVKSLLNGRPRRIDAAKHGILPEQIDRAAAQATARLQQAGHETYIVGGAVRDLLLRITPKDFDIATAATPHEVRRLFRRSRIIGRRFQIVHLQSFRNGQRHLIEVTTFRGDGEEVMRNEQGRILADNVFGGAADDAVRRDFSCNALFYDPASGDIIDYVGGYEDIRRRRLRVIGVPAIRFQQDPVRILRGLRLAGKLGLTLNKTTRRALADNAALLADISPSRLFDEVVKVINSGAAAAIIDSFVACGVAARVLPAVGENQEFVQAVLQDTDRRRNADKDISLSFVISGLFWPPLAVRWHELRGNGATSVAAMEEAATVADFTENVIVPRRIVARVMDLYFLSARMEARLSLRRVASIMRNPLFVRALAFAELRRDASAAATAKWWREYQQADAAVRKSMLAARS